MDIKKYFEENPTQIALQIDKKLLVKSNNKNGYKEAKLYDCIGLSHINYNLKHSRVTHQISNTLTTQNDTGVVVNDKKRNA